MARNKPMNEDVRAFQRAAAVALKTLARTPAEDGVDTLRRLGEVLAEDLDTRRGFVDPDDRVLGILAVAVFTPDELADATLGVEDLLARIRRIWGD